MNKKKKKKKEVSIRNKKIQQAENKLKQREIAINRRHEETKRKSSEVDAIKNNLEKQLVFIDQKQTELVDLQNQHIKKLEDISGLSAIEAKDHLVETLKEEAKSQAQSYINDIIDDAKMTANKEAKRIVVQSIQRVATETAIENSVTVSPINENGQIKSIT